jgi:hypothetical protein
MAGITPLGRSRLIPDGPDCITSAGPPSMHCSGQARPGFPGPGRITPLQGRDLLPLDHFRHSTLTPLPGAGPRMPLGSDWHILHHHMLVLGCPLAQTSILLSSSQSYP